MPICPHIPYDKETNKLGKMCEKPYPCPEHNDGALVMEVRSVSLFDLYADGINLVPAVMCHMQDYTYMIFIVKDGKWVQFEQKENVT